MGDTSLAAERVRVDAIRSIAPIQRLVQALELSESVRALAIARLEILHADRTELELMELLVGAPLMRRHQDKPHA